MVDLYAEAAALTKAFDAAGVPYALCGGLALAVHGHPRATKDIDLIVPAAQIDRAKAVARGLGFSLEALPMKFRSSGIEARRVSKLVDNELLMLDLLLIPDELEALWESRTALAWNEGTLWVISRAALVSMKLAAGRPQDLADIARLEESS